MQSQNEQEEKLRKAHLYKKRACKMLMKLTQVVNFINIIRANISYERHFGSFFSTYIEKKLPKRRSYKIFLRLTLMKLNPAFSKIVIFLYAAFVYAQTETTVQFTLVILPYVSGILTYVGNTCEMIIFWVTIDHFLGHWGSSKNCLMH